MTHWTLYVLKLEQGKYYVGITKQTPEKRFQEHLGGRRTYWTEKYPPIKIIQTVNLGELDEESAKLYEKRVTRKYMKEKGINNVRGGDLKDVDDIVTVMGYFFPKYYWLALLAILILLISNILLLLDKYS